MNEADEKLAETVTCPVCEAGSGLMCSQWIGHRWAIMPTHRQRLIAARSRQDTYSDKVL